jgi:ADP-ribose pyrophosphatase
MSIPSNAKKVFTGILFDIYQWEQEMFDGSTATFEMLARQASTEVIATVEEKIVLLNQVQPNREPYPSLPGGRIEKGEEPLVAAKRELAEESGYTSDTFELLYSFTGNSKLYFPEFIYVAKDCHNGLKQSLDTGEKITVTLVTFDEFLHTVRVPLFAASWGLKQAMLEALLDEEKYEEMRRAIFGE